MVLAIYDENQRPDDFSFSDSIDGDEMCLQPSIFVGLLCYNIGCSIKKYPHSMPVFLRFRMKIFILLCC